MHIFQMLVLFSTLAFVVVTWGRPYEKRYLYYKNKERGISRRVGLLTWQREVGSNMVMVLGCALDIAHVTMIFQRLCTTLFS